jgi:hypothetical protein
MATDVYGDSGVPTEENRDGDKMEACWATDDFRIRAPRAYMGPRASTRR